MDQRSILVCWGNSCNFVCILIFFSIWLLVMRKKLRIFSKVGISSGRFWLMNQIPQVFQTQNISHFLVQPFDEHPYCSNSRAHPRGANCRGYTWLNLLWLLKIVAIATIFIIITIIYGTSSINQNKNVTIWTLNVVLETFIANDLYSFLSST